jgi:hypothetical protein
MEIEKYVDLIYGRNFILGKEKINNEKNMDFDEMTNIINILRVVYIYIQVFGKMPQVLPI